jgi:hypothetical protein
LDSLKAGMTIEISKPIILTDRAPQFNLRLFSLAFFSEIATFYLYVFPTETNRRKFGYDGRTFCHYSYRISRR